MNYSKDQAIENLRNVTEYLQFTLFSLCLATSEESVPIHSVEKIHITLSPYRIDLTEFGQEIIKDRKNLKRFNSTLLKLLTSGVSMACNIAEKYYEFQKLWSQKRWKGIYPFAYQVRNMYSHAFFWHCNPDWSKKFKALGGTFPIIYKQLKIEESWSLPKNRKALIADLSPCGELLYLIEDIILDVSNS